MWMNESEIDHALEIARAETPHLAPYVQYLSDWRDTVNQNSDGWAYWKAGAKCADKLSDLANGIRMSLMHRGNMPTEAEFRKALTPIKATATRHGLPAPTLQEAPAPEQSSSPRPF